MYILNGFPREENKNYYTHIQICKNLFNMIKLKLMREIHLKNIYLKIKICTASNINVFVYIFINYTFIHEQCVKHKPLLFPHPGIQCAGN